MMATDDKNVQLKMMMIRQWQMWQIFSLWVSAWDKIDNDGDDDEDHLYHDNSDDGYDDDNDDDDDMAVTNVTDILCVVLSVCLKAN